jgi:hypothetical protein
MILPIFHSGLGNQLFQFASAFAYAKRINVPLNINYGLSIKSSHSALDYRENVLSKIFAKYRDDSIVPELHLNTVNETTCDDIFNSIKNNRSKHIVLNGYFQWEYMFRGYRNEIISHFVINAPAAPPTGLERGFFLHFRRGDYVGTVFWRDLTGYYLRVIALANEWCAEHGKPAPKFFVLSDDIEYCKNNTPYLSGLDVEFLGPTDYTEIETMWIMSKCQLGGAAANSTFSWWGLYLNYERPLLYIPDCYDESKYNFPEVTVVSSEPPADPAAPAQAP